MSKQYPECPLYKHDNCKEFLNPKLCAVVREDKICVKKKGKPHAVRDNLTLGMGMGGEKIMSNALKKE